MNVTAYHKGLKDGGPLQLVRPGCVDFSPVGDLYSVEMFVQFHMIQKEAAWRKCDEMTRKTGRLVKLVVVNDFWNMSMSIPPKKIVQSFGESSKLAEKLYPQLLQTTVCCNAPTWFSWVMKISKLFLSKRTTDKFKLCPKKGKIEDCPFVKKYFHLECVPSYLGGPCRCEHQGGCVAGVSNDVKTKRMLTKEEIQMMKDFATTKERDEKGAMAAFLEQYAKEQEEKKKNKAAAALPSGPPPGRPGPPPGRPSAAPSTSASGGAVETATAAPKAPVAVVWDDEFGGPATNNNNNNNSSAPTSSDSLAVPPAASAAPPPTDAAPSPTSTTTTTTTPATTTTTPAPIEEKKE